MKINVWSRGSTVISADPQYQEPAVREALAGRLSGDAGDDHVAMTVIDWTDSQRSDISHDQYAVISEDDGTELWRGWLSLTQDAPPPAEAQQQGG